MVAGLIGTSSGMTIEQLALNDRIAALASTQQTLLALTGPTPPTTAPSTPVSTRPVTPDPIQELLELGGGEDERDLLGDAGLGLG